MNMKSTMQILIGLLSAVAISTAVAMDREHDKPKLTEEQEQLIMLLDVNNDGVISFAEAQQLPELAERFNELDRTGSGQLERAEFARFEVTEEHIEAVEDNDYDDPEDWQ